MVGVERSASSSNWLGFGVQQFKQYPNPKHDRRSDKGHLERLKPGSKGGTNPIRQPVTACSPICVLLLL
jgi:hypothetical protein